MDLIFRAGGLKESAYKQEAEVARIDSSTIASKKSADVYRVAISGNYGVHSPDPTFKLQRMDQVFVRQIPDWQTQRNVVVTGMTRDGTYLVEEGAIAGAVKSLRFTQSYVDALAGTAAVGSTCKTLWAGGTYNVPAVKLERFSFTSSTR